MRTIFIAALLACLLSVPELHTQSVEWDRRTGDTTKQTIWPNDIAPVSDSGTIIALNHCPGGSLLRLSADGYPLWRWASRDFSVMSMESVQQTNDGGFIACGYARAGGKRDASCPYDIHALIVRLRADGTVIWQKLLGSGYSNILYSIRQMPSGGFIAAGVTYSTCKHPWFSATPVGDGWVVILSADGEVLQQKTIGGERDDRVNCIRTTTDGGYIILMQSESYDGDMQPDSVNGQRDNGAALLKLDSNCSVQWKRSLGQPTLFDFLRVVRQTLDGGYISTGISRNPYTSDDYILVVKTNGNGAIEWEQSIGSANRVDMGGDVQQIPGGRGYMVTGNVHCSPDDKSGFWVGRLNASGDLQWQACYGSDHYESANVATFTYDGGFVVAGRFHKQINTTRAIRRVPQKVGHDITWTNQPFTDVVYDTDVRVVRLKISD